MAKCIAVPCLVQKYNGNKEGGKAEKAFQIRWVMVEIRLYLSLKINISTFIFFPYFLPLLFLVRYLPPKSTNKIEPCYHLSNLDLNFLLGCFTLSLMSEYLCTSFRFSQELTVKSCLNGVLSNAALCGWGISLPDTIQCCLTRNSTIFSLF